MLRAPLHIRACEREPAAHSIDDRGLNLVLMRRLVSLNGVNALPNGKVAGYLSLSSGGRRSPTMDKTPFGRVERLAEAKEKASRVRAGQVGSGG
jgi:hypothetical protein